MSNALQLRSYGERHAAQQGAAPDATLRVRYAPALTTGGAGELHTLGAFIMHSVQHDRGISQNASGCLKTFFHPSSHWDATPMRSPRTIVADES